MAGHKPQTQGSARCRGQIQAVTPGQGLTAAALLISRCLDGTRAPSSLPVGCAGIWGLAQLMGCRANPLFQLGTGKLGSGWGNAASPGPNDIWLREKGSTWILGRKTKLCRAHTNQQRAGNSPSFTCGAPGVGDRARRVKALQGTLLQAGTSLFIFSHISPLLIVGTAQHPKASLSFIPSTPAERQPQMWDIWGHTAGDAGTVWVPTDPGVSHPRCSPISLGASPPPPPLPGHSGGIDKLIKPLPSGLAGETDRYWSFYF